MHALSRRNDDPEGASRPFDLERDGFVFGEGAVVLILETEEHAVRRGASVYAEALGGALTSDAFHLTAPEPSGRGARMAMTNALKRAEMEPHELDYIAAHATSTPIGDIAETQAIKAAFGDHARKLAISANKSMVGHLLGAAGAISALACVLAIRDGMVPPTINLTTPTRTATSTTCRTWRARCRCAWRSPTASASAARTPRHLPPFRRVPRYLTGIVPSSRCQFQHELAWILSDRHSG